MRIGLTLALVVAAGVTMVSAGSAQEPNAEEQIIRAAGLSTDDAALLGYFQERVRAKGDSDKLLALARKLGDSNAKVRSQAASQLVAAGPAAIAPLRHVVNDLDDAMAAEEALRCLEWLEGSRRGEVAVAAARLLGTRKVPGATEVLLAFLPLAEDATVIDGVKAALGVLATPGGKPEPALLKALKDPVPLRRAVAVEILCGSGHPEVLGEVEKLLADAKPQVRLRAALALVQQMDAKAIGVLIDLLAELPASQRTTAEEALQGLAGDWAPNPALAGDDEVARKIRRDAWSAWWRNMDGPTLTTAFRKRTLQPDELVAVQTQIDKLGDKIFAVRERAAADLVALGGKVAPLLHDASNNADLELAQRAQYCLKQITKNEEKNKLPAAAARLLAMRDPAGASATLLDFLPYSDDEPMRTEIGKALKHLVVVSGKPDPALVKALGDTLPTRRAAAAEALACAAAEYKVTIRNLLTDPNADVRQRVAIALAYAHDKGAVPVLIDLVADSPRGQAWQAEEVLYRLAGNKAPGVAAGDDAAARKKFREAWTAWWKDNADAVDLTVLEAAPNTLGFTLVAEFGQNGINGRVVEVDRAGKMRWQIDNLNAPVDAQFLPGNRVLIAEGGSNRVSERDLKGNILWQVQVPGYPTNVQRLPNGNTFVAISGGQMMEVDKGGKTVLSFNVQGGTRAAYKAPNGQILCLTHNSICIRLDPNGKELKRFTMNRTNNFTSGIDITPKGTILVAQNDNTVMEYDQDGKVVWQAKTSPNPTTASRLANGHTLVCSYNVSSVTELDQSGRVVWEYKAPPGNNAFRARQR
jgi:HEAT repeat protein